MAGLIAVEPTSRPEMHDALVAAVRNADGEVTTVDRAEAMIWADPHAAQRLPEVLAGAPQLRWVQLPFAGIEPFVAHLDHDRIWTSGKGVYAEPVAEWVMTALLTGFRAMPHYVTARSWQPPQGRNLLGASLCIVGAGGITDALLTLLAPWGCDVTVVRRRPEPHPAATRTVTLDRLGTAVADADALILACALTDETRGIVDAALLDRMADDAWLINVARGGHVVTDDLTAALANGAIAGAVLDVTDPEPLPDNHPLWQEPRCIITPHVGNTPEMGLALLARRVGDNVTRWRRGEPLLGVVDVDAGY